MNKLRKMSVISVILCSFLCLNQRQILAADGTSTLEILPIEETYPRIYEVNDLDFGRHRVTKEKYVVHPKSDLTITLLDARVTSIPWELQVRLAPLVHTDGQQLSSASIHFGEGMVSQDQGQPLLEHAFTQQVADQTFQTVLRSESDNYNGWVRYTIDKKDIALSFSGNNQPGKYLATNQWRFIHAKF